MIPLTEVGVLVILLVIVLLCCLVSSVFYLMGIPGQFEALVRVEFLLEKGTKVSELCYD